MSILDEFVRVSKQVPCGTCERPDWCLVKLGAGSEPEAYICARVESRWRWGEAGWYHPVDGREPHRGKRERWVQTLGAGESLDFTRRARAASDRLIRCGAMPVVARDLGVSEVALERLWTGVEGKAIVFPMRNGKFDVIGLRKRWPDGGKSSVRGSKNGVFVASNLTAGGTLYVTEGPTDTAALLTLHLPAIGRPSCNGGIKIVDELVQTLRPNRVVIVADADQPGQDGAHGLGAAVRLRVTDVRIVVPPEPYKDAREWVEEGALARDVEDASQAVPSLGLPGLGRKR